MAGSCHIDAHPRASDIAKWLNEGLTSTAINNKLRADSDPANFKPLPASSLSYHRLKCLGLQAQMKGRPRLSEATKALRSRPVPDPKEVADEALKLFFYRMKEDPEKVKTSELTPVLTQLLRLQEKNKDKGKTSLDELMGDALENDGAESEGTSSS